MKFARDCVDWCVRKATVAAAFAAAFACAARAEEVTGSAEVSGGGVVEFEGASSTNWVYNADTSSYDFILTFANASSAGSFTLPGTTKARILAVGGGGGGGGTYMMAMPNQPYGGGGGGGAGGLVETDGLFGAGTYSVAVGAGGAGGPRNSAHSATSDYSGKDGGDTTILTNGVAFMTAYGGGAGGGETDGHSGGSGGGGSKYRISSSSGTDHIGGSGVSGQGYAGGLGNANNYGGGGGGAGGAGAAASTSGGGIGGTGVTSDITGESVSYAPGGGGGCNNMSATTPAEGIAGGNNDEFGRGGVGQKFAPTAGENGKGGGGGGASFMAGGAKGGDGVVIVRIAASLTGGLDKPTNVVYEYDGTSHTSYSTTAFYTVTGDNVGTAVGTYVAVVTPAPGIKWTDGTSDSVTVVMTIKAADSFDGNVEITGAPVSFVGAAETNWIGGDLLIKFTGAGSFTLPGTTKARILAVGGGGGGGGTYMMAMPNQPYGGGGGGGAGGLVETNDLFGAGTYSVAVGAGGAGGPRNSAHSATSDYSGKDGGDTTILTNGGSFLTAYGGGGGGGETDGHSGGSGGGGSMYRVSSTSGTEHAGGSGVSGQGHAGGSGDANNYGGGGGGAGGAGAAASTSGGGIGGAGVASDITGESVSYAPGGGGGCNNMSATTPAEGIAGGNNDEFGRGGVGQKFAPTAGENGKGGGGGGASFMAGGAKGGDGVVYVRISKSMSGSLERPPETITITYDGNAHTSIVSCAFYHLTSDSSNIGTNAGSYTATAVLEPGCTWLDGSSASATITMVIKPVAVTLNSLSQAGWTYMDDPTPDPVCDFTADNPSSISLVYEYAASEDADVWSTAKPENAGTYFVRVRTADEVNYEATPKSLKSPFTISPVSVTFSNLRIRDWLYGTPEADTPNPKCTVSPSWVEPVYEYADAADAETWSAAKPTAAGTHYLRVRAPDAVNYSYEAQVVSFRIVKGLGGIFTDYVEINVDGWTGSTPTELSNFPFKLTLSEQSSIGPYAAGSLVGFLYARAGVTGDDIAFTDEDGNVLCFYMESWQIGGDSTVYVKIPNIGANSQKIRLYWHLRDGQAAPEHQPESIWSNWTKEERDAVAQPSHSFGLVYKDGVLVNYFTQMPEMDKTTWAQGDTSGSVTKNAVLAEGDVGVTVIDASGEVLSTDPASLPTTAGTYRITFAPNDPDGEYEPISCSIDFNITGTMPTDDLSGGLTGEYALTLNGRVMLANDDVADGHAVLGQAYWRTREVDIGGGKILTNNVYWTHEGSYDNPDAINLCAGSIHRLNFIGDDGSTNVLWRLNNVLIGNTYPTSGNLASYRCALPWSSTALGNSSYANRDIQGDRNQSGNLILRNIDLSRSSIGATVYSPCYTNGVGTIYFDALNMYRVSSAEAANNYRIVVEVATSTDEGLPPTDENAQGVDGSDFGKISTWTPCEMLPLKRDGNTGVFVEQVRTNDLALGITKGGTSDNFYRVCVPVNCREPVRFRIRRVSYHATYSEDQTGGMLLLDNIVVSYPGCSVSMSPYGKKLDLTRGGKQVVGQEGAMKNVPFPSVSDADGLLARGKIEPFVGPMGGDVKAESFVQSAKFHYRWRYLNQKFDPADGSWRSVALSPFDDYEATEKLQIPAEPGDVEFWYELKTMMPFYSYYDYSGTGAALGGLYTEEVTAVTNRMDTSTYARLPSGGSDWFVRLREGASDFEGVNVLVSGAYMANQEMELISDHVWRGLVKVPSTDASGKVSFMFQGMNRQTAGDTEFRENETTWYPTANAEKLPWRGEVSTYGGARTYDADGASTYIEFTYNDASGTYSIGHAAYQNFNGWHDANLGSEKFVGNFSETSGVTTATMVQTNANMSAWTPLRIEDSNWNEPFYLANYSDPGYKKGVTFGMHKMPGQWNGDNGMFVDEKLTTSSMIQKNSGIAWQMQGEEQGDVTFTQSDGPSGLDTLSFKTRLGQSINFDDFSVWYGDGSSSTNNYTIVVPAILSSAESGDSRDYAPGASMSVVAYYQPKVGCYELRAERINTDGIQISLYKWEVKGYKIKSELLLSRMFANSSTYPSAFTSGEGVRAPKLYAMLISVGEYDPGNTTVLCGLSTTAYAPSDAYSGRAYNLVCYVDKSSTRHKKGSYGVLPTNCNGVFLYPRQYSLPIAKSSFYAGTVITEGKGYYTKKTLSLIGTYNDGVCKSRLNSDAWAYSPARVEMFAEDLVNHVYEYKMEALGIRALSDIDQKVNVYLKPRGAGSWPEEPFASKTVSSYSLAEHTVTVRTNANCDVRITAGEAPVDVTIHDIKQTSWNGADIENIGNLADDFVYTQARVKDETVDGKTTRVAMLQPARAKADKALSIRSPLLKGLGMIGFSYKDVKPGCEVWVQAATNSVAGNLTGTFGYNFSTSYVELGESEPIGSWITLRRYTYHELATASAQTYYCGWHTHDDNKLVGAFRLVVAPSVVAAAQGHALAEPEWGSITITDVVVHDEPALDKSSWLGWNIRTMGDDSDSERRMFLPDSMVLKSKEETSYGMSVGLNNSTKKDIDGDESKYDKINPTVQSPTFGKYAIGDETRQATIGLVRFRARLYETNTASTAVGKISVYGVMDGSSENWGTALTNFTVDSFVYKPFEYRASSLSNFAAVRLVVDGVTNSVPGVQRVLLDEVVVSERVTASVGFAYARPFRTGLNVDKEITNILDKDQQPLIDESWGVQAKLKFDKYDSEIDTDRGFRVYFRYFVGTSPWGYSNWEGASGASAWTELTQVGETSDYIFRSSSANTASIVPSQPNANTVVQYMLYVQYYLRGGGDKVEQLIELGAVEGDGWTNPPWYAPIDYNESALYGKGTYFSPYTILDGVSPGRVWINEVNYNDGPKAQTGGIKCVTNQFIELAVPWGVDLKGWKVKLTDMNHKTVTLAELGKNGVPTSKKSANRSGDYDFLVLRSPETRDAGGIPEADGTWTSDSLSSTFKAGTLQYDSPYQLELFRPSGILEHQFVVAGTNEWRTPPAYYQAFGYQYDGTNLLNELNVVDPSAKRFYAGEDLARKANGVTWSSLGVFGEAHGEDGGWSAEMKFTPGRVNEGQDELVNWYLKPNGASIWVYAQSKSPHVKQAIGDDTAQDTYVIVYSGTSTNITYTIDPWYAIGALTVNGVTNSAATGATDTYTLNLNNITETTVVVATGGVDPQLLAAGLDPADRYTPAIMNWLSARYAAGELANPEGPISLGHHKGLLDSNTVYEMPLKVMYWLDLDPTEPGWWMRHGFVGIRGEPIYRKREWPTYTEHFTNRQVTVKMYLSNDVSHVVYAPYRLQGLGNEQSDIFTGNWTSETFKVKVMLNNGLEHNVGFLPFRWFTFAPGSFNSAFESRIEILDPLARSSAGYSHGWYGQSCNSFLYSFSLDEPLSTGVPVEVLEADSTYDGPPYEDDN